MKASNAEIKAWLNSVGKDREWLAAKLNTTKSVVDSWFSSRGFPKDRMSAIVHLMANDDSTSLIRIPFSDDQFKKTQKAANTLDLEFQDYCQKAIETQVENDLNVRFDKAAEEAAEYKTKNRDE